VVLLDACQCKGIITQSQQSSLLGVPPEALLTNFPALRAIGEDSK